MNRCKNRKRDFSKATFCFKLRTNLEIFDEEGRLDAPLHTRRHLAMSAGGSEEKIYLIISIGKISIDTCMIHDRRREHESKIVKKLRKPKDLLQGRGRASENEQVSH